jgi:hypothetical protein
MTMIELPTSVTLENDGNDAERPPVLPFLHMWTAQNADSRIDLSHMGGFGLKSVGGGASPQWMRPFPGDVASVTFAILPVGWTGDWHESPKPQWVIPLRGRWFIETMDGTRVEMGPGDIHFGQDQGTTDEKGHRSGQIGDEPCFQLMLQFETSPAAQTRDPFGG